jgi:hypothetical protein
VGGPADDDGALGEWFAHHAALMVVVTALVTLVAAAVATFLLPSSESSSVVVDTAQEVPARQLGVVGEALFRAEDTYREAMAELGMSGDPEALYRLVALRAVPESRLLIVVARTDDPYSATVTSDAMAQALVHAFQRAGYPGLRVLGAPQPSPTPVGLSVGAVAIAGAIAGAIVAFAVAILLYRSRGPVLTMARASSILDAERVASIPGRGRWLGALRADPPALGDADGGTAPAAFGPGPVALVVPRAGDDVGRRTADALGLTTAQDGPTVVLCSARTRERDLREIARRRDRSGLLWIS